METTVISENLLEKIKERKVLAAVFTTYTFEADFFELEVVPLLLSQDFPYSYDDKVKHFLVSDNLREANLPIEVFYDLQMVRKQAENSPGMEYLFHGINLGNNAFHGKINFLLLEDNGEQVLLFGVGSNNLTRAGWWDNVECQHWVEVSHKSVPASFIKRLRSETAYLKELKSFDNNKQQSAIDVIEVFLSDLKGTNSSDFEDRYFGLSASYKERTFLSFLTSKSSPLNKFNKWNLEIISPFFADDSDNKTHNEFFDMGIEEIKILLPFDDEENALCHADYYKNINDEENVHWAKWSGELVQPLGSDGEHYRRLHAKIYHFYNKKQSWIFVGSVNYTHKAFNDNAEAGMLTRLRKIKPLLEALDDSSVEKFADLDDEILPGVMNKKESVELPELHICYDWVEKKLTGRTAKGQSYYIQILNAENITVINPWKITGSIRKYDGEITQVEEALSNGSLVKVVGCSAKNSSTEFPEHTVMVQQIGWSHKPLNLPDLTAEQILAIYAGMDPEKRKMMLVNAKVRALILSSQAGELTTTEEDILVEQFFSEYAEIFNAFRTLRKQLDDALDNEQYPQLDYYLTGLGVDSLKTLISMSVDNDNENNLSSVSRYLILLSATEIYKQKQFVKRTGVSAELNSLQKEIIAFKKSDLISLEDNSASNRNKFFNWFEEEFFRVYRAVGANQ